MRQGERLEKKYNSPIKTLKAVIEELKQRVATIATNVNRSYWKTDRFKQKRLLQNNHRQNFIQN